MRPLPSTREMTAPNRHERPAELIRRGVFLFKGESQSLLPYFTGDSAESPVGFRQFSPKSVLEIDPQPVSMHPGGRQILRRINV